MGTEWNGRVRSEEEWTYKKNRILMNGSKETDMFMTIVDTSVYKIRQSCLGMCGRNRYVPIRAMERYHTSHTKTTLPTRQSAPRPIRQSDHTKTSWPSSSYANWSGMGMSPVHLARYSERGKKTKQTKNEPKNKKRWEDNIREWTGLEFAKSQRAVENREKNGGNWLWSHLCCPKV